MNFKKLLDLFEAPSINQTNTNIRKKIAPPPQAAVSAPTAASIIGNSPQVRASQTTPVANPGKPEAGVAFNQGKPPPAPTAASIIGNSPQVQASKSLPTTTAAAPVANPGKPEAGVAFNQGKNFAAAPVANPGKPEAGVAFNQGKNFAAAPAAEPAQVAGLSTTQVAATPDYKASVAFNQGKNFAAAPAATPDYKASVAFNQGKNFAAAPAAEPALAAPGQRPGGIAFNQDAGATAAPAPALAANPGTPEAGVAFNQGKPAPEPAQAAPADSNTLQPSPDKFAEYPQSDLRPGRQEFGFVSEEDEELNELMRLSGRPVNEKAVSKQQQKFMGMVHAMQKGKKIKGASPELKKVAKTMNNKDARDFASTKHNGLPTKVSESIMLEAGSAIEHIINKFKHETKNFLAGEELDRDLFEALFDYYSDNGEMPYGVAKARDGDPYQWIENHFEKDLEIMGYPRDFNAPNNLAHDHELADLARLAGLTNEDGPGASSLYGDDNKPSRKFDPIDTLKQVANKGIDTFNDYEQSKKDAWDSRAFGGTPGPGHSGYIPSRLPRFQTKSDTELADRKATDRKAHDLLTGANAAAAQTPPADSKKVKEDAELNQMRRIAGLKEAQPPSPGAAKPHAPRERERVVSPKVDKFDKDQEAAEKARRWIVDKESPNANNFGRKIGKAVAEPIAAIKSAWHGATDAWDHEMGNNTAPDPKPPVSVVKKNDWKGDKDNPALKECGDNMSMEQNDSMNVSTNMSSDGNKSINISAQGDQADALLQMLKMAGMRPHDNDHSMAMTEPEIIMIGRSNDEMMDEERETEYSNTPEEEYQTIDSIIRQGNDLNREKRQYASKPRLGDNPMSEGVYDPDYTGNYNNEFDELEDLFSKSAMDSSEMNRQRFLANKHGINSPADMSKLPSLRKDAETGYKTRKSEIDAELEKRNEKYMQDKLMDLEYQADPSAFLQRRMPQSAPKEPIASPTISDLPKADYSLGGRGAKLPNFNLEPAAPDANDLLDKATDQLDSRLRSRPSMSQQLAQLRNRTRQSRMAESLLDADLDAMLESILIRENDGPAKKVGDAVKNPSDAAKDVGDKVKGRLSFTKDTDGKTSVKSSTGRIRATIDGNKTHYAPAEPMDPEEKEKTNEGMLDDVSNFFGDVVGTEASKLRQSSQLRDLDAMRKQYKGTPYEKQVNDRYDTHLNRLQLDKGDVMDYDPKTGVERLKPVVPPDQWKGGN